ncbi:hypothetical protein AYO22_10277 [Fonsecaea multimorphosa]|nr:hypothetical protein AYO22_10277 [Fonsecaea multimorphosa]
MAGTITISVAEYQSLLKTGQQFVALKQALLAGGATTETLDVLIGDNLPPTPSDEFINVRVTESLPDGGSRTLSIPVHRSFNPLASDSVTSVLRQQLAYFRKRLPEAYSLLTAECTEEGGTQAEILEALVEKTRDELTNPKRSIVISGLSPVATLDSLAQGLKGGAILQMYLRPSNRSAHVNAAWDDRQTRTRPSLTTLDRTRNLVIRFASPELTADGIRADLDHIHHLEIVHLFFKNGHAYISLNSIQSALTARNCMLSRLKYKRFKIDFYPDECAQPLPPPPPPPPANKGPSNKSSASKPFQLLRKNRFEMLWSESEESEESSDAGEA